MEVGLISQRLNSAFYIVPTADNELTEEGLRQWMEKEITKYMRPKHIRLIKCLPQTPTHKIEKYKLKEMVKKEREAISSGS